MWTRLWAWISRNLWPLSRLSELSSKIGALEYGLEKLAETVGSLETRMELQALKPRKKLEVWKHPVAAERAIEERLKQPPWFRPSP